MHWLTALWPEILAGLMTLTLAAGIRIASREPARHPYDDLGPDDDGGLGWTDETEAAVRHFQRAAADDDDYRSTRLAAAAMRLAVTHHADPRPAVQAAGLLLGWRPAAPAPAAPAASARPRPRRRAGR